MSSTLGRASVAAAVGASAPAAPGKGEGEGCCRRVHARGSWEVGEVSCGGRLHGGGSQQGMDLRCPEPGPRGPFASCRTEESGPFGESIRGAPGRFGCHVERRLGPAELLLGGIETPAGLLDLFHVGSALEDRPTRRIDPALDRGGVERLARFGQLTCSVPPVRPGDVDRRERGLGYRDRARRPLSDPAALAQAGRGRQVVVELGPVVPTAALRLLHLPAGDLQSPLAVGDPFGGARTLVGEFGHEVAQRVEVLAGAVDLRLLQGGDLAPQAPCLAVEVADRNVESLHLGRGRFGGPLPGLLLTGAAA